MKAVIMAGGEGTRLRPLTCTLPKPMVPILNRPMMEHILNLLKRHGFNKIANTLWYLPDDVIAYFQDGSAFGVQMEYYVEREPLGTAGSVKNASEFLTDTFIVVSGDALTDIDLGKAIAFHRQKSSVATLVLTSVANPLSYGVVLTDEAGKITQFLEKPSWSEVFSDTVNTGIYVLEPEVLDLVEPGHKVDFSQDLFPELLRRGAPLFGYVAPGYWSDVGNLEVYRQAQKDCLDRKVTLDLPKPAVKGIYLEEDVRIHRNAQIKGPIYIGRGSRIGADAFIGSYSVIGSHSKIAPRVNLKQSLLWSGVNVGERTQLRGCVCAKNVIIEKDCAIYEGAVLGPKVQVGAMTMIAPNTKVWPEKSVLSGTKLRESLIWGSQDQKPIFSKQGVAGDLRGTLALETLIKFGLSYASFLGRGKEVLITSEFIKSSELAKRALVTGLRGGGLDVRDGGEITGRITRFAVQDLALDGALHVGVSAEDPNFVFVECWNNRGRLLTKAEQRKIEGIFIREDYPRMDVEDLGEFIQMAGLKKRYLRHLAAHYPSGSPGFKVGLQIEPLGDPFGEMVQDFLQRSGYGIETEQVKGLPTIVIENGLWFFQDEKGELLSAEDWWNGFAHALKWRDSKAIAIPVNLSEKIAQSAERQGLDVHWTRMEAPFWMETATELGNSFVADNLEIFPYIEPLASIGELLSLVSSEQIPLSSWQNKSKVRTTEVKCPWSAKGKVMRKLIESSNPDYTLYLDGIKEHHGGGWVLIAPDGDEPVFRLYSEAENESEAQGLLDHYTDLIQSHQSEER